MTTRPFKQVDVFTRVPYRGNPLAVVLDARGLSTAAMQSLARWTNLSETTFVVAPSSAEASYRVRIFTPAAELPFAGHPTLGTAHALLEAGLIEPRAGRLVQECGVGLVELTVDGQSGRLQFRVPDVTAHPIDDGAREGLLALLHAGLASEPVIMDLGPRWLTAAVSSRAVLRGLSPDLVALADYSRVHRITGLNLFAVDDDGLELRSFAPAHGVPEDPVCGSGQAAAAAYLRDRGRTQGYAARQGYNVGRDGFAFVDYGPGRAIRLGGDVVTCVDGQITVPTP